MLDLVLLTNIYYFLSIVIAVESHISFTSLFSCLQKTDHPYSQLNGRNVTKESMKYI